MSAERPNKDEIFNAAAELADNAKRQAFLNEVCVDDPQLREEIEDFLERDLEAGSFLEPPPRVVPTIDQPTIDQPTMEMPGAQIGPYTLLQKIGEGGMGTVYMAEQKKPVMRRVALKVVKPGMDTGQVIARFEAGRQALAMMDHPNIAKVLDAGTTNNGRPYFVMELVKGIPVTQYCDERRLAPIFKTPINSPTTIISQLLTTTSTTSVGSHASFPILNRTTYTIRYDSTNGLGRTPQISDGHRMVERSVSTHTQGRFRGRG